VRIEARAENHQVWRPISKARQYVRFVKSTPRVTIRTCIQDEVSDCASIRSSIHRTRHRVQRVFVRAQEQQIRLQPQVSAGFLAPSSDVCSPISMMHIKVYYRNP
jgi:outer membrane lipopolysaccharide assembly protein LptE/RlpB